MRILSLIAVSCLALSAAYAQAHDVPKQVHSIYWSDGDSGWINGRKDGFAFRLSNIDAPETRSIKLKGGAKCEAEIKLGYDAKAFVVEATKDKELKITRYHYHDRYDRHVIDLSVNGKDLATAGIESGHYGSWRFENKRPVEARPDWCAKV